MNNNQLITINQNSKQALVKSKNLLDITKKLLENKNKDFILKHLWIDELLEWVDQNNIFYFKYNFNLDGIISDLVKQIYYKISIENNTFTNDNMFQSRLDGEIQANLNCIFRKEAFIIELPFANGGEKTYHLFFEVSEKILSNLYKKNNTKEQFLHGIPLNEKELLNLEYLNLEWQHITISPILFNLKNVKKINLKYNSFSRNPYSENWKFLSDINNFKKLEEIYLKKTYFTEMPINIARLDKLIILSIENNINLKSIPKEFILLKNLKIISLKGNPKLILTEEQKTWIRNLGVSGCQIFYDEDLFERSCNEYV